MAVILRPATAADQPAINALIKLVDINPMDLKWPNFLLAVDDASGQVVASGQIKPHGDGTHELASIATHPDYQHRGLATQIINRLLAGHPDTLWLMCLTKMGPFYERFGFQAVTPRNYSRYFKRMAALAKLWDMRAPPEDRLLVMRRDRTPD